MGIKKVYIIHSKRRKVYKADLIYDEKNGNYFAKYKHRFIFIEKLPIPTEYVDADYFLYENDRIFVFRHKSDELKEEEIRVSELAGMLTSKILAELMHPTVVFMLIYIIIGLVAGIGLGYILKDFMSPHAAASQTTTNPPVQTYPPPSG